MNGAARTDDAYPAWEALVHRTRWWPLFCATPVATYTHHHISLSGKDWRRLVTAWACAAWLLANALALDLGLLAQLPLLVPALLLVGWSVFRMARAASLTWSVGRDTVSVEWGFPFGRRLEFHRSNLELGAGRTDAPRTRDYAWLLRPGYSGVVRLHRLGRHEYRLAHVRLAEVLSRPSSAAVRYAGPNGERLPLPATAGALSEGGHTAVPARLAFPAPGLAVVRRSLGGWCLHVATWVLFLVGFVLPTLSYLVGEFVPRLDDLFLSGWVVVPLDVAGSTGVLGVIWYSLHDIRSAVLDREANRLLVRGKLDGCREKVDCPLSDVAAVQICRGLPDTSGRGRLTAEFEVNLVCSRPPGMRIQIMRSEKPEPLHRDAARLAGFLGVPVLDRSALQIMQAGEPNAVV